MPLAIRRRLGLEPGTVVSFEVVDGAIMIRKGASARHPVDRLYGTLRLGRSVDSLLDEMRGPRVKR